jgi:hypothetical protein
MPFQVTRTFTRQTKQTDFYVWPFSVLEYIESTYDIPKKRITRQSKLSDNELEKVLRSTWPDEATFNAYMADPKIQAAFSAFDIYNTTNNITAVVTKETI